MAERTLRGSRLGAVSYETDRNAELAPRSPPSTGALRATSSAVPFADDAEIPTGLGVQVRRFGRPAHRRRGAGVQEGEAGPHALGHADGAAYGRGPRGGPGRAPRGAPRPPHPRLLALPDSTTEARDPSDRGPRAGRDQNHTRVRRPHGVTVSVGGGSTSPSMTRSAGPARTGSRRPGGDRARSARRADPHRPAHPSGSRPGQRPGDQRPAEQPAGDRQQAQQRRAGRSRKPGST